MDLPFTPSQWVPSRNWEVGEREYPTEAIAAWIKLLNRETQNITRHPYDPSSWLRRARVLQCLRYPELAVGDAHKATLLCCSLEKNFSGPTNMRLGCHAGFWLLDDDAHTNKERKGQTNRIEDVHAEAIEVLNANLDYFPTFDRGRYVLRAYPWMREEHLFRSDELLDKINGELLADENRGGGLPACVVQRYAFGKGVGARDGADLLGVFARRDIKKKEVIVIDRSLTWGCNGPGSNGTNDNLFGGVGCQSFIHPNTPDETTKQDLRWVRTSCGKKAADVLVRCRFLLCAIEDCVQHPLDHHLFARLTPTYREVYRDFSLVNDIAVPNQALQQFGIDIFANLNFDTWVLFVLMARIENNAWSDPISASVNPLFSLFNHSCEENVTWNTPVDPDHSVMHIKAARDIQAGEQLFVIYDSFVDKEPLDVRRERFKRWLNGPCQCTRCIREESEQGAKARDSPEPSFQSESSWDTEEKPVFPEDEGNQQLAIFRGPD